MGSSFGTTLADGVLASPWRAPRNSARHLGTGSIHDDTTAQQLGFRGGTVAGSLHMEQFPPLLLSIFGDEWYRTGGLSLYFKYATIDGEEVRTFALEAGQSTSRIPVWMDDREGHRVAEGTASVGPDPESEVRRRIAALPPAGNLRIFADLEVGKTSPTIKTRISKEKLSARLAVITEPLPAYEDASIFGKLIMTPESQVHAMRASEAALLPKAGDYGVGLFGAIELQSLKGPALVEQDYENWSRLLAIGETPKTEFIFYESILADPATGDEIMRMLMMSRVMKASSPLYS